MMIAASRRLCNRTTWLSRPLRHSRAFTTPAAALERSIIQYPQNLFAGLNLKTFTADELRAAFDQVDTDKTEYISKERFGIMVQQLPGTPVPDEAAVFAEFDVDGDGAISRDDFQTHLQALASRMDPRVYPLAFSMGAVGGAVGIVVPALPILVQELGGTPSQFGIVIAAFALTKLLGNIPAAYLVDRHGRRPYLMYSLLVIGASNATIGIADCMEAVIASRLVTGFAVAAYITSTTMYVSDISTPLNRAKMLAPGMASFSAGMALGPAIGGLLTASVGLHATFLAVGGMFAGVAAINAVMLKETSAHIDSTTSFVESMRATSKQWSPLLANPQAASLLMFQCSATGALASTQMTLMPLHLVGDLGFSAPQVGACFAFGAGVQLLVTPQVARIADRIGTSKTMLPGGLLCAAGMGTLGLGLGEYQLAASLMFMSIGGSCLQALPVAHMSNLTSPKSRAQALALLRTSGDFGMLIGAASAGYLAEYSSTPLAMQAGAGILALNTGWYGYNALVRQKRVHQSQ